MAKFPHNNLINELDLSHIKKPLKLHLKNFEYMSKLQHIIVNDNTEIDISDLSGSDNLKSIFRIRNTNEFRTTQPTFIQIENRRFVDMDIPYNTNVLFPNPVSFNILNT